eukprot:7293624-Lingulodinium_polyedra.AAC.1
MTVIDAHGDRVQDKHYILKDPENDVLLAKKLVTTMLGQTVPWPSEQDMQDHLGANSDLQEKLRSMEEQA